MFTKQSAPKVNPNQTKTKNTSGWWLASFSWLVLDHPHSPYPPTHRSPSRKGRRLAVCLLRSVPCWASWKLGDPGVSFTGWSVLSTLASTAPGELLPLVRAWTSWPVGCCGLPDLLCLVWTRVSGDTTQWEWDLFFCLLKEYLLSTTSSTLGVRDPREKHCLCERQTATERENFFQLKIWFRRSPRFSWRKYEVRNKPKLLIYPSILIVGHSTRPVPSTS